jgi:hypothetical protein
MNNITLSKLILIGLFCFNMNNVKAQDTNMKNINGWEFLQWTMDKTQVENALKNNGITYDPGAVNQKSGPTTKFVYQDMQTRLAYDENHLYDIQQYKYFNNTEKTKADSFFIQLKEMLVTKYGKPVVEKYIEKQSEDYLLWELKYTKVELYYHKSEKVYPGFEDQTYSFFLHTTMI